MHRIDQPSAVSLLPAPAAAGTPGYFSSAVPGSGTPTIVDNDWCNDIQEELISILTAAGVTPSKTVHNQVLSSLQGLFANSSAIRIRLSGNANYYVSNAGNDGTGDGSVGNPWATLQYAVSYVIGRIDTGGWGVTINAANGTYAPFSMGQPLTGGGALNIVGNAATPSSCVISTSTNGQSCVTAAFGGLININGFKVTATGTGGIGLNVYQGGQINVIGGGVEFGACTANHISALNPSSLIGVSCSAYKISGAAAIHISCGFLAQIISTAAATITITGTPAFSSQFAYSFDNALIDFGSVTFSGSATGKRFAVANNATINTSGGGASYFPGSIAGTGTNAGTSPYGLYV